MKLKLKGGWAAKTANVTGSDAFPGTEVWGNHDSPDQISAVLFHIDSGEKLVESIGRKPTIICEQLQEDTYFTEYVYPSWSFKFKGKSQRIFRSK